MPATASAVIQTPTLILTADCDQLVPAENGRLLAKRIAGAKLKPFTNTGHLIYLERAQTFHQTVMGFFQSLSWPGNVDNLRLLH